MINILSVLFITNAIIIVSLMVRDALRGTTYLFSIRNVFLLGFIVFQVTSPIYTLQTGMNAQFDLINPIRSGTELFFTGALFFAIFYLAYPRLPAVAKITNAFPISRFEPSISLNIAICITLTALAIALHFGVNVPLVGVLARFLAISFSAIACGLAGWVWAPRLFNPVFAMFAGVVLVFNGANAISGSFGRRELVAVLGCFLWGMFYSWWRRFDPKRAIVVIAIIGSGPLILLALFTSARSSAEHDRTAAEQLTAVVTDGSISEGMMLLLNGQNAGGVSMWCIENFPERNAMRPLHTMKYAFLLPIPRAMWPGKPMPLSKRLPYLANMTRVHKERLSIGPGILGHAAAEGGFYAIILYAIILAYVFRILDELQLRCIENPLIVLPMGSALGQVMGIPRGESGVFLFILVFSVIGSYLSLIIVSKVLMKLGFGSSQPDDDLYDEYSDYGSEDQPDQQLENQQAQFDGSSYNSM